MRSILQSMTGLSCMLLAFGCSLIQSGDDANSTVGQKLDKLLGAHEEELDETLDGQLEIANPPAKTIRFDGREVVLGINDVTQIAADPFSERLSNMLDEQKYLTAKMFVAKNADTAEQVLWEKWATEPDAVPTRFIANILSQNVAKRASWNAMLAYAKKSPVAARNYQRARSQFTQNLRTSDPTSDDVENLRVTSQRCRQPLVVVDAMQLMAVAELVAGRNAWAESLLLQAVELAEQQQDHVRAANLWLMISMYSSQASDQRSSSATAWRNAVVRHSKALQASGLPLNIGFWVRADRQKPSGSTWPDATKKALLPFARPVGCKLSQDSSSDLVICSAIGNAQLEGGEPQLALVNFKKAETFADGQNIMWLRIAQSTCLATLGQGRAAAALLSEPLASSQPVISAAANAALGSAKLHAGTFQQGAQLLNRALVDSPTLDWPNKSKAEADLALAMLVIGETDQGLKSLHAAQRKFEINGDTVSLLQSLENEMRLLNHEGKVDAAKQVHRRILRVERLQAS